MNTLKTMLMALALIAAPRSTWAGAVPPDREQKLTPGRRLFTPSGAIPQCSKLVRVKNRTYHRAVGRLSDPARGSPRPAMTRG